jgi:hypothetical protein
MSAVIPLATLAPGVVAALRCLDRCFTSQAVIAVSAETCEVDWNPKAPYDPSMAVQLILLTAAIDAPSAEKRWSDVSFVDALCSVQDWDDDRKAIVWALGEQAPVPFDDELVAWVGRFNLGNKIVSVNRACVASSHPNSQRCVRPIDNLSKIPALIRKLPVPAQLAAVAYLCFHNPADSEATLNSKRFAVMNPPVMEALATLRAVPGAAAHLLRLIPAFQGW